MTAIRIRKKLDSETLELPELKLLIGKTVDITIEESAPDLAERFVVLVGAWRRETEEHSSASRMALHPAYQEIIAMGMPAVPLLLGELRKRPDFWFKALREITKENPVPARCAGNVKKMADAWIKWGKKKGLIK